MHFVQNHSICLCIFVPKTVFVHTLWLAHSINKFSDCGIKMLYKFESQKNVWQYSIKNHKMKKQDTDNNRLFVS